jgi:hypothetical protein
MDRFAVGINVACLCVAKVAPVSESQVLLRQVTSG